MIFTEIIGALTNAGVRFVVVGGVAAGVHGSTRVTFDLDICYDPAPENTERLATVLLGWHTYLRGLDPGLPFVMDATAFRITPVMTLTTDHGPLDVMDRVVGVGDYSDVLEHSVEVEAGDVRFRALSLAGLVNAKRAARRKKDLDQLPELEALLAMTRKRS
jgi:predicted nucleotidyltransferase